MRAITIFFVASLFAAGLLVSGPQAPRSASAQQIEIINEVPGGVQIPGPHPGRPGQPSGLKVDAVSPRKVILIWNPPQENPSGVAGYKIYRNGSFYESSLEPQASDTDTFPDSRYCYAVSAFDLEQRESSRTGEVCITTPGK